MIVITGLVLGLVGGPWGELLAKAQDLAAGLAQEGGWVPAAEFRPQPVHLAEANGRDVPEKKPHHPGVLTEQAPDEVQNLKTQIIELQNKGELGFRKVVACSAVEGYGMYSPLEEGSPIPQKLFLYFEPSNVSTLVSGDRYIIDLSVDILLTDPAGKVLGTALTKKINRISYSPLFDIHYAMAISLKELGNRDVILRISLRDNIKNRTVTGSYRINVQTPGRKPLDRI